MVKDWPRQKHLEYHTFHGLFCLLQIKTNAIWFTFYFQKLNQFVFILGLIWKKQISLLFVLVWVCKSVCYLF